MIAQFVLCFLAGRAIAEARRRPIRYELEELADLVDVLERRVRVLEEIEISGRELEQLAAILRLT
jgi:hypothetical protein